MHGLRLLKRVLLVDVEPHVLQVMKSTLDRNGFEVDTALTVSAARQSFAEYSHQVVVINGDARETLVDPLCAELTQVPVERQPLILLALAGDADAELTIGSLPCESLSKPLSLRYLVARLAGHFGCYQVFHANA